MPLQGKHGSIRITRATHPPTEYSLALVAHVFAETHSLHLGIAFVTQSTILIANETAISQFLGAHLTSEALWMPTSCHRLDHSPDDEFAAFIAARGEEDVEITLAILATFEFVKDAVLEGAEALGASEREWIWSNAGWNLWKRLFNLHETLRVP